MQPLLCFRSSSDFRQNPMKVRKFCHQAMDGLKKKKTTNFFQYLKYLPGIRRKKNCCNLKNPDGSFISQQPAQQTFRFALYYVNPHYISLFPGILFASLISGAPFSALPDATSSAASFTFRRRPHSLAVPKLKKQSTKSFLY